MGDKRNRVHKNDGWVMPKATFKNIEQDPQLDPVPYYDEWNDNRDGMRNCDDKALKRDEKSWLSKWCDIPRWNKKIKKLLRRRKQMKKSKLQQSTLILS